MEEPNGTPTWVTVLITAVASIFTGAIAAVFTYLGVNRTKKTEDLQSRNSTKLEMKKVEQTGEKMALEAYSEQVKEYRSYIDGMRGRITGLETRLEEKDEQISTLQEEDRKKRRQMVKLRRAQKACVKKHQDCEEKVKGVEERAYREVTALKSRMAEIERKNNHENPPSGR